MGSCTEALLMALRHQLKQKANRELRSGRQGLKAWLGGRAPGQHTRLQIPFLVKDVRVVIPNINRDYGIC